MPESERRCETCAYYPGLNCRAVIGECLAFSKWRPSAPEPERTCETCGVGDTFTSVLVCSVCKGTSQWRPRAPEPEPERSCKNCGHRVESVMSGVCIEKRCKGPRDKFWIPRAAEPTRTCATCGHLEFRITNSWPYSCGKRLVCGRAGRAYIRSDVIEGGVSACFGEFWIPLTATGRPVRCVEVDYGASVVSTPVENGDGGHSHDAYLRLANGSIIFGPDYAARIGSVAAECPELFAMADDGEGNRKESAVKETFEVEVVRKDKDGEAVEQLLPITPFYGCEGQAGAFFEATERVVDIAREKGVKKCDWTGVRINARPFRGQ